VFCFILTFGDFVSPFYLGGSKPPTLSILIIDTIGRNNLRWGPIKDPIKSLVECGISDDVETVFVDGIARMEDRKIDGVDMAEVTQRAQSVAEDIWDNLQEWDPLGRTAEQMCPWSFPIAE